MHPHSQHFGDVITTYGDNSIAKVDGTVHMNNSQSRELRREEITSLLAALKSMSITTDAALTESEIEVAKQMTRSRTHEYPHIKQLAEDEGKRGIRDFLQRCSIAASPALVEIIFSLTS